MKKLVPLLFIIGLALCQPRYDALQVEIPPTIDGDLSEYQGKPFLFLPHSTIPEIFWRGPRDAEAKIWLCWDKDNLYIAGEVWDDFLAQKGEPWQESLQLCISPDLEITYSPVLNKLFVFKNGVPMEAAFPFAVKSTNASYQMELAIPWDLLGIKSSKAEAPEIEIKKIEEPSGGKTVPTKELAPSKESAGAGETAPAQPVNLEGVSLKFNAVLYETDLGGYRGYLSWAQVKDWNEGMGIMRDTTQFGDVVLSTKPSGIYQISFFFAPSPIFIGDEEVEITPWLMFTNDYKGKFRFVLRKDGETLLEKDEDVEGPGGFSPFPVRWDARGKPEGTYIAEASLTIEGVETKQTANLTINKYDAQRLVTSMQEEIEAMKKGIEAVQPVKSWQGAVLVLQGNAWISRASPFLELLNQKIKETAQPDPDARVLSKIFLWESTKDVAMHKGSSALIRGDFQSPILQQFPTLKIPASKDASYIWNWERWQGEGSLERLSILFANLPVACATLWSHPNSQVLSLQRDSILSTWRQSLIYPEQIGGTGWQGWTAVSPQGGAQAIVQQGNHLWLLEALSKDACLSLLNSALSGEPIRRIDSLLPPLQPDILVEDIGKVAGFNFKGACFFAAKDDIQSLALAQTLREKLGGKMARLEEVNRYKDVVIVGLTALKQLVSGFKLPTPEREAYILSRYLWGKNVLILVGKEPQGTQLAVDILKDLIDYVRDKTMLVGDMQTFTNLSSGTLSPYQLCLSSMGGLCDFVGIVDRGTREGARDALWLSAEKGWQLTVIPGEAFPLLKGAIIALGGVESIQQGQNLQDLLSSIHNAGGLAVLVGGDDSMKQLPFDAWGMELTKSRWVGKPFVTATGGDFSLPLRTAVFSKKEGIYDILTAIKRGDCLAFSPFQKFGSERINRLINILIDEKAHMMRMFSESIIDKSENFSP